jgi:hypothetical protein
MTVNELPGATPAGIVATTWVCCACGGGGEDMRNCAAEWLQPWPTRYDLLRLLAPRLFIAFTLSGLIGKTL